MSYLKAFPGTPSEGGMDLRDYFAAKVLGGITNNKAQMDLLEDWAARIVTGK